MTKARKEKATKYTLVQHSGYGYGGKLGFRLAVEVRQIEGKEIERVEKAGGVLFDTFREADEAENRENYPPGVEGIYPRVRGRFHKTKVDQLAIYLPDPKLGLVRKEEVQA